VSRSPIAKRAPRLGIITDVHANDYALQRVIAHGHKHRVSDWIFLGDAVGYFPQPVEVLRRLREIKPVHILLGNHEAHLDQIRGFFVPGVSARTSLRHHSDLLQVETSLYHWWHRRWRQETAAQAVYIEAKSVDIWLIHGALPDEWPNSISTYLYPWRCGFQEENDKSLLAAFTDLSNRRSGRRPIVLICGHTHLPTHLTWEDGLPHWQVKGIHYGAGTVLGQAGRTILNPGSVGWPHNPDPHCHAAYGILDLELGEFEFHRVPYSPQNITTALAEQHRIVKEMIINLNMVGVSLEALEEHFKLQLQEIQGIQDWETFWKTLEETFTGRKVSIHWPYWKNHFEPVWLDDKLIAWKAIDPGASKTQSEPRQ
jgi:predicted phosphodiesterase